MEIRPGLTGTAALEVAPSDTARALGSGALDVLGTPRVVALAEAATVSAVAAALPAGATTVGTHVDIEHTRPSPVGARITATAVLGSVDGRNLTFEVTVRDGERVVAAGRIRRATVDVARFLARLDGAR